MSTWTDCMAMAGDNMLYKLAIKAVITIHIGWAIAALIGCLLALKGLLRNHPLLWIGFVTAMALNGIYLEVFHECPLTNVQNFLLHKQNPRAKKINSFVGELGSKILGHKVSVGSSKNVVRAWMIFIYVCNIIAWLKWR